MYSAAKAPCLTKLHFYGLEILQFRKPIKYKVILPGQLCMSLCLIVIKIIIIIIIIIVIIIIKLLKISSILM